MSPGEITLTEVVDVASKLGVVSVLALLVVAIARQWLVPGWYATELRAERDEWKKLAQQGQSVGEKGATLAERTADVILETLQQRERDERERDERDRERYERNERRR